VVNGDVHTITYAGRGGGRRDEGVASPING